MAVELYYDSNRTKAVKRDAAENFILTFIPPIGYDATVGFSQILPLYIYNSGPTMASISLELAADFDFYRCTISRDKITWGRVVNSFSLGSSQQEIIWFKYDIAPLSEPLSGILQCTIYITQTIDATFTRTSIAYNSYGEIIPSGTPRFELVNGFRRLEKGSGMLDGGVYYNLEVINV